MKQGATRWVFLTKKWAIKIPRLSRWRTFLWGLLGNLQEVEFSRLNCDRLCPVKFSLPLGFLVVMPRVQEMTPEEFDRFDYDEFIKMKGGIIPAEPKPSSFGWLGDKVVCIDYG